MLLDNTTHSDTLCPQSHTSQRFAAGRIVLGFVDFVAVFHLVLYL
jgi:hypothetical protein